MTMPNPSVVLPQTTGKYLVLLREDAIDAGIQTLRESVGVTSFAKASDFEGSAVTAARLEDTDAIVFDRLSVAVVALNPEQLKSLNAASDESNPILAIEPERVVYAMTDIDPFSVGQPIFSGRTNLSVDYLRGYRDAVVNLVDHLIAADGQFEAPNIPYQEVEATWDLQLTRVVNSPYSGRGIKLAVLDTGLDFTHPDFTGRQIFGKSFVNTETAQDGNGHGTHVTGKAGGPSLTSIPPRYGVAYESELYVGKVLTDRGGGTDSQILAGMEWAISNGCQIISMSLGAPARLGQPFSRVFETVARRALQNGTLIIAAAGNESDRRRGIINPVAHPANCPSIMAVAALNSQLQVASFSNAGLNPSGGQIDIAAPGVDIYSSWLMPIRYRRISGTSMATPHVSGIAALYAEATGATGQALWNLLTQNARRLTLPARDVGIGLVQAPVDVR